ncbi:MAG: hypothetical protein KY460_17200, partial [Actinobacteria bacterium]|nr:hypothetical protein [Actinomycetota bacterium]
MTDAGTMAAAAGVVAAAPSTVRNRLAAIARSSGTYRTVLVQMLQDAVGRRVGEVEVVTPDGELTEVGEEATRLAAAGLGDDAIARVQEFTDLATRLGI